MVEKGIPICKQPAERKLEWVDKLGCDVFESQSTKKMNEFTLFILLGKLKIPVDKKYKWIGMK